MKHPQFLFVCCSFSIVTTTSCSKVEGYSCVTAFWDTVSCVLNITGDPSNTTFSLKFSLQEPDETAKTYVCQLEGMNHRYHTVCKVVDRGTVDSYSEYTIELCTASNDCQLLTKSFFPAKHIELTAPLDLKVQQTATNFNFTWRSGYETHLFASDILHYELLLEAPECKDSNPFHEPLRGGNLAFISVPRSQFKWCDSYCIKVRTLSDDYNEMQSEWSNWTCWESDDVQAITDRSRQDTETTPVILTKVLPPVCVVFALLLCLFYSPAARMKIKTLAHTPSPAPFFQPLFEQYEGNLQDWLSSHNKCTIMYKPEEMLRSDAVTVEPKALEKDLEDSRDFPGPLLMLPATQCHTSYVGLPGMHQASSPVTVVCPGGTSYTQLPCSIFSLGVIQVEPSAPEDSLEISCSDSGCSFDSLTETPGCSSPPSPVVDTLPFQCSDYCILNKTAEGVVPVLVTKGSSPDDMTDPRRDADGS